MRISYKNGNTVKSIASQFSRWFEQKHTRSLDIISIISGYRNFADLKKVGFHQTPSHDIFWDDVSVRMVLQKIGDFDFYRVQDFLMRYMSFPSTPREKSPVPIEYLRDQLKAFRSGIVFIMGPTWVDPNPQILQNLFKIQSELGAVGNHAVITMLSDDPKSAVIMGEGKAPPFEKLKRDITVPCVYFPRLAKCQDIFGYLEDATLSPEHRYPGDIMFLEMAGNDVVRLTRCGYDIVSIQETIIPRILKNDKDEGSMWAGRSAFAFPVLCHLLRPYLYKRGERLTIAKVVSFLWAFDNFSKPEIANQALKKMGWNVEDFIAELHKLGIMVHRDDYSQFSYTFRYALNELLDMLRPQGYSENTLIV